MRRRIASVLLVSVFYGEFVAAHPFEIIGNDLHVAGHGATGDKWAQLARKTAFARDACGFRSHPRVLLSESILARALKSRLSVNSFAEVRGDTSCAAPILERPFTQAELPELARAVSFLQGISPAIVLRSSAHADARGTGAYESAFAVPTFDAAEHAFRKVLASYFSRDAIALRTHTEAAPGMAMIVEPAVGQQMNEMFLPPISGHGYTFTPAEQGALQWAVPGLGGGVYSRFGEPLTRAKMDVARWNLGTYVVDEKRRMRESGLRNSHLLQTAGLRSFGYQARGFDSARAEIVDTKVRIDEALAELSSGGTANVPTSLWDLDLRPLFDGLDRLHEEFGPQYVEWAATVGADGPAYWLLQLADVQPKLDVFDFGSFGKPLFQCHTVVGAGRRQASELIFAHDCNLTALREYNAANSGYVLVYSSALTTSATQGPKLTFADGDNAAVWIELQSTLHQGSPLEHLRGLLDSTDRMFGVIERADWDRLHALSPPEERGSIEIYRLPLHVVTSEAQSRLAVFHEPAE